MSFISLAFLIFLFIVLVVYYIVPKKYQWIVLLISSFIFYAWASIWYVLFLLFSIISIYLIALNIGKIEERVEQECESVDKDQKKAIKLRYGKKKKALVALGIILNLCVLIVVKYLNFICSNVVDLLNKFSLSVSFTSFNLILPLGLSFYTFQSIGYLIDVYRGMAKPQKNIFKYALFVSYFPQLLQGPIGRYNDLSTQLYEPHYLNTDNMYIGFQRMVLGFFKKIAIADMLSIVVNPIFNNPTSAYGIIGILGAVLYALQLYADFSGFMDITIGCSKMLGIQIQENFNKPYLSKSISEYWRRWHITLGAWFRDYVYYPLFRTKAISKLMKGKNRKITSKIATVICLLITWVLIGFWHGANWTYILHGTYYGVIISIGVLLEPVNSSIRNKLKLDNKKWFSIVQIIRTFAIVCFGYILFNSSSLSAFGEYVQALFTHSGIKALINNENEIIQLLNLSWVYVAYLGIVFVVWNQAAHVSNQLVKINTLENISSSWKIKYVFLISILIFISLAAYIYLSSLGIATGGFIYYEF